MVQYRLRIDVSITGEQDMRKIKDDLVKILKKKKNEGIVKYGTWHIIEEPTGKPLRESGEI